MHKFLEEVQSFRKQISKRIARFRRKHGIFSEQRSRVLVNDLQLAPGVMYSISDRTIGPRGYILDIDLNKRSPIRLEINYSSRSEITTHHSKRVKIPFFCETGSHISIQITNIARSVIQIRSISIHVISFAKGVSAHIDYLFHIGSLHEIVQKYGHMVSHPKVSEASGLISLLNNPPLADAPNPPPYRGNRKYLYYLNSSKIFATTGYSIRSHCILKHLPAIAQTKSGYPGFFSNKIQDNKALASNLPDQVKYDGVTYHFDNEIAPQVPKSTRRYIDFCVNQLVARHTNTPPIGVIATSNYVNGLIGYATARSLGRPFGYEMRGLWHLTKLVEAPYWESSDQFKLAEELELQVAELSDQIFVLSPSMRDWLVSHRIAPNKICIAPNGIAAEQFKPSGKSQKLITQYGLQGAFIFAFIGTLTEYEGIDILIESYLEFHKKHPGSHLLIVGDGNDRSRLMRIAGGHPNITFTGQVPFDKVHEYYGICDILVYPRTSAQVCEVVPPIKPIEAMAAKKLVICSDVKPLKDYLKDGELGVLFTKDDANSLTRAMANCFENYTLFDSKIVSGRKHVAEHYSWRQTASLIDFCKNMRG